MSQPCPHCGHDVSRVRSAPCQSEAEWRKCPLHWVKGMNVRLVPPEEFGTLTIIGARHPLEGKRTTKGR